MLDAMNESVCIKHFLVKWNAKLGFIEVDNSRDFEERCCLSSATDVSVCAVNILVVVKF